MHYVRVAVNVPAVSGVFDYHLPDELVGKVRRGCLLTAPFGAQLVQGVALDFPESPSVEETKAVVDLLDEIPVLTAQQLDFAEQLAVSTLNPLAAIVEMMLPSGLSQQADTLYALTGAPFGALSPLQSRLVKLLEQRGALRGRQINSHFSRVEWKNLADALVRQKTLSKQAILPAPTVRPKMIRTAQLAVSPEEAQAAMPDLGTMPATQARREAVLKYLIQEPQAVAVSWVYAESGCKFADLQILAERELITLHETEVFRDPLAHLQKPIQGTTEKPKKPVLTSDQKRVWDEVSRALFRETSPAFLLHGVTGSGKTEIYLRAAERVVAAGKQAIILVPEIALTPQTVRRFHERFPGKVGLLHSKLSAGERYDTWRRARSGKLSVVIGARSALFVPLPDIGLIVADECHDSSYSQSEQPFYNAVDAAMQYAEICGAVCILGSATPPVALRYKAEKNSLRLLELPSRLTPIESGGVIPSASLPQVTVVDMREELKAGNRGIFSRELSEALAGVLERGEQAILFLNRRGTATHAFCRDCGHTAFCPRCETPLVFHTQIPGVELTCHRCGYQRKLPKKCPQCESVNIKQFGLGSERVEQEVKTQFPSARVLRWDWETTREKDAHELILSHFASHRADVLVGTQMLAKGLDLPLVTLVGIVLADVGINLPDPFAGERAFQLLTQVSGRAGRSQRGGRVVMQTFQPENPILIETSSHDYRTFFMREIESRKGLGYPPFARLARLEYRHQDNAEVERIVSEMAAVLRERIAVAEFKLTELIGPAPCYFAKVGGFYRWQIAVRSPDPARFLDQMRFPPGWRVEIDPADLL